MTTWWPEDIRDDVNAVCAALANGSFTQGDNHESRHVDLKEEAGRRSSQGLAAGSPHNETAAKSLARDAACMSNTDRGGVLIVGASDDGTVIGTQLDGEWLRRRIYDLTQRQLTVDVSEREVAGQRLLLVRCPEAIEPIRMEGRIRWRVHHSCVEVDPATWHDRRMRRSGFDWSSQPSGLSSEAARAAAVERARDFLRASNEQHALELAESSHHDLLSRLNVVTADGMLTNAGMVAFVGRPEPALDYIRREAAGADSVNRVRQGGRGLLEELFEVEQAIRLANPVRHVPSGLVAGQARQLPPSAVRETVVNGCVHRDWTTSEPTLVEHEGASLVVTSPGGFIGGVTPANIITHPSQPRNRSLAELFAALRVAEREGIGVDRMVREMIRVGHAAPAIQEVPGPRVRTALVGDLVDEGWMKFLALLEPAPHRNDLNSLLVLRHLVDHRWVDAATAAPLLQRTEVEALAAIHGLSDCTVAGRHLMAEVTGVPDDAPPAWHLTTDAMTLLMKADAEAAQRRRPISRAQIATHWATVRGRISTTELGSIVGASPTNVGQVLKSLESQGVLAPGRSVRRGPGFFYKPADG